MLQKLVLGTFNLLSIKTGNINSRYRSIIFERFRYDGKILISAIIIFILVMSFYMGACTRAKNIFHCLMYIIYITY